jgi:hypothetical protein
MVLLFAVVDIKQAFQLRILPLPTPVLFEVLFINFSHNSVSQSIYIHYGFHAQASAWDRRFCSPSNSHWAIRSLRGYSLRVCFLRDLCVSPLLTFVRYDTGTIGGILAMPYWRNQFSTGYKNLDDGLPDVSPSQSSMIVSLLSAGTFFGALTAAPTGDIFGRRLGLIISVGVFVVGVILQTAATGISLFVAGKLHP